MNSSARQREDTKKLFFIIQPVLTTIALVIFVFYYMAVPLVFINQFN